MQGQREMGKERESWRVRVRERVMQTRDNERDRE